jgi:hypothetical protein
MILNFVGSKLRNDCYDFFNSAFKPKALKKSNSYVSSAVQFVQVTH